MYINHNKMASNVANNLTSHYSNLATSTQRLSSGLRVNSAADDAAGLAIRELMRSDIAALNQGVRNANDAISLIQTADGALGIIDEKLIRMKELAEQAATGTYDSTQRLMIDSEYQQMASEITRIANSTDFNGIKLLNGNLQGTHDGSGRSADDKMSSTGALKVHFGPANDSAEDYYYVDIKETTSQALGLGNASTWQDVQERGAKEFKQALTDQIKNDKNITDAERAKLLGAVDTAVEQYNAAFGNATDYKQAFKMWNAATGDGFMPEGKNFEGNSTLMNEYLAVASKTEPKGGASKTAADLEQELGNAIADSLNGFKNTVWATDDANAYATQKTEIWNELERDVRTAAKNAGLTDTETNELLFGANGKENNVGGLQGEFELAMKTKPATQKAGLKNLEDLKARLSGTGQGAGGVAGTGTAADQFGGIKTFLARDNAALTEGTATNGDVIALRNAGNAEYVAKVNKPTTIVSTTDDVIKALQDAVDAEWEKIDTSKTGAIDKAGIDAAADNTVGKEYAKVLDAVARKAQEIGFSADEAKQIKTVLSTNANMGEYAIHQKKMGDTTLGITIDGDENQAKKDWAGLKGDLKNALKGLNNEGSYVMNKAFNAVTSDAKGAEDLNATKVANALKAAVDDLFAKDVANGGIDITKGGDLAVKTSEAGKELIKIQDAIKIAAKEQGMSNDDAKAISDALFETGVAVLIGATDDKAGGAGTGFLNGTIKDPGGTISTTGTKTNGGATITNADIANSWTNIHKRINAALDGSTAIAAITGDITTGIKNHADSAEPTAARPIKGETMATGVLVRNQGAINAQAAEKLDTFWNGLSDAEQQKLQYAWGKAASYNLANATEDRDLAQFGIDAAAFEFNKTLDSDPAAGVDNNMLKNAIQAGEKEISTRDFAGYTIQTQEDAQQALTAINDAIIEKDKTRAHLGALQNRLENTVSNLTVQSENLQAAESRISDVDVATEMTQFVRNQILTQSAVAMLSQANSMPQMAMQLIG